MTPEQAVEDQAEGKVRSIYSGAMVKIKVKAYSVKPMYLVEDEKGDRHWVREDTIEFEADR